MNKQNRKLVEVECPEQRIDLISYLEYLSDPQYQQKDWLIECHLLDSTLDYYYDETVLSENPHLLVGIFLKSDIEANMIEKLISIIEPIRLQFKSKYGENHYISRPSDVREFIDHPDWNQVIITAKEVLDLVLANDKKQ